MKQKILFIDRDGTIIKEPADEQIDAFEKLTFYPKAITCLSKIAKETDYLLVMISNQDGLGTDAFPEKTFWPVHQLMVKTLEGEGVHFTAQHIDRSYPKDNSPNRKPQTGMLTAYFSEAYALENSLVIGDRLTDVELAKNLGAKAIYINSHTHLGENEITVKREELDPYIVLETDDWEEIYHFLNSKERQAQIKRKTKETDISIQLNLDGTGKSQINTGISFFDHMLEQIAKHGQLDLFISTKGDLEVDEHHTIEDTALALGEAFHVALGNKLGIERYGFCLPMDDCLAQVALDFGGRNWLIWEATFQREMIGKMPTEMFQHFFKSFTDMAKCNLNIQAEGENEHHKIEAIFKAFAKSIKMAKNKAGNKNLLPSTKGVL